MLQIPSQAGFDMIKQYLSEFPIPVEKLPRRLRQLLEPIGDDPETSVEVASRYEFDLYGPDREYVHTLMVLALDNKIDLLGFARECTHGVVASTPYVFEKGGKAEWNPSFCGAEYVVASWGSGSFYSYNLAEKIWMGLGLSARCIGGDQQKLIYDDLSMPEFAVAEGEVSTEYHFSQKKNVRWVMKNSFLRRYLWMRGRAGVRVLYYEALLPDDPEMWALLKGQSFLQYTPDNDWCEVSLREHNKRVLLQVYAAVPVVAPELCVEMSADGLVWPGDFGPMTHDRANSVVENRYVFLDDRFLEKYEQTSLFETMPTKLYGSWYCSPSYLGQWSFTECVRVGRNIVRVPMRELYKAKPDREILHAYSHALDPSRLQEFGLDEEHIVAKTARLLDQMLRLGDHLAYLSLTTTSPRTAFDIIRFSREEIRANGWLKYPELSRLAHVASTSMTEQAFLSRCKSIHEIWQRIPNSILHDLITRSGHNRGSLKNFRSNKLLQALLNIVERLNANGERMDDFGLEADRADLKRRNSDLAPLFVIYDLRVADAHDAGGVLSCLERLNFDVARLSQGYGHALDHVFDRVIGAFSYLNDQITDLRMR